MTDLKFPGDGAIPADSHREANDTLRQTLCNGLAINAERTKALQSRGAHKVLGVKFF